MSIIIGLQLEIKQVHWLLAPPVRMIVHPWNTVGLGIGISKLWLNDLSKPIDALDFGEGEDLILLETIWFESKKGVNSSVIIHNKINTKTVIKKSKEIIFAKKNASIRLNWEEIIKSLKNTTLKYNHELLNENK